MGCNVREKSLRGRKHRHSTVTAGKLTASDPNPNPNPNPTNPNPPNPNPNSPDEFGWEYCTEEQLEELLLKNLDRVHKEAISRLVSLGYDESLALHALLSNGHCYGSMDALSNVLQNALSFLESGDDDFSAPFADLRRLQEYSLTCLIHTLRQFRPHLTRGDAMWRLLVSQLHLERAASIETPPAAAAAPPDPNVVDAVMKGLESLRIEEVEEEEKPEDQKKEMILDLVKQIRDLEGQVRERKEWAQQKAVQAAKRLSNDLTELRILRMEKEENERAKGRQAAEDSMVRRLAEMEAALKKASGQADRANAVVQRLEAENAEIRAEMEACKLSAAESEAACLEVAKRERRCMKRLLAWEKQKERLQAELHEEREAIAGLQRQLEEVHTAQKEAEVKWRQEIKAKEQAIAQVDEERGAKEETDASIKRKHEVLRRKFELDYQRHKDDIHMLEEELSRLRASASLTQLPNPSNTLSTVDLEVTKEIDMKLARGFNKPKDLCRMVKHNRVCVICMEDEVCVLFLPCAHQVVCVSCNEDHERAAKTTCPCCNLRIEQRIRVYGASS